MVLDNSGYLSLIFSSRLIGCCFIYVVCFILNIPEEDYSYPRAKITKYPAFG
ncbi:MAG: hypothetical protein QNJ34_13710 [Xenococcaceae cyanobacterium MO_188.B29]|nr:hypothetical protein [Xenococcaceae cyanobacterium MO_188.B29]